MPQGTPPCGTDLKDPDLLYAGIVAVQSFLLDIQAVLHPHAVDIFDIIIKVIQAPSTAHSMYRQLNGPFPEDHWQRLVSKTDYSLAEGALPSLLCMIASVN